MPLINFIVQILDVAHDHPALCDKGKTSRTSHELNAKPLKSEIQLGISSLSDRPQFCVLREARVDALTVVLYTPTMQCSLIRGPTRGADGAAR